MGRALLVGISLGFVIGVAITLAVDKYTTASESVVLLINFCLPMFLAFVFTSMLAPRR